MYHHIPLHHRCCFLFILYSFPFQFRFLRFTLLYDDHDGCLNSDSFCVLIVLESKQIECMRLWLGQIVSITLNDDDVNVFRFISVLYVFSRFLSFLSWYSVNNIHLFLFSPGGNIFSVWCKQCRKLGKHALSWL